MQCVLPFSDNLLWVFTFCILAIVALVYWNRCQYEIAQHKDQKISTITISLYIACVSVYIGRHLSRWVSVIIENTSYSFRAMVAYWLNAVGSVEINFHIPNKCFKSFKIHTYMWLKMVWGLGKFGGIISFGKK